MKPVRSGNSAISMISRIRYYTVVLFILCLATSYSQTIAYRLITADYHITQGPLDTFFRKCVGAGRANEGLRADWQEQLALVKKECGFSYLRMHGLLHDDMGVYSEDRNGNPLYNWQYIDALYDALLRTGIRPFVELSFMPAALASKPNTVFWWKGNISYPKDEKKWEDLIHALVRHFTERYGAKEVTNWYFEVWNEPNLRNIFFTGTQDDYFKLYAITTRAIKSVNSAYRVGGPATAGSAWVPDFTGFCATHNIPVDFISTHSYGVNSGFVDLDGRKGTILSKDPDAVSSEVEMVHRQIAASPFPALPLHYTEWSSSYTPTDPIHDTYQQASFILDKIKKTKGLAESMSYWVFTDIFEENGPRFTPFHGGFGLLNYEGIKKPAFFAYRFLNRLGKEELKNDDASSIVCRDSKGGAQVLLWDFTISHPDSVNDQVYYKRELPSADKGTVKVELKHLPKGQYEMKTYRTGYRHNDAYSAYIAMGSPPQLTKAQVETLKSNSSGAADTTGMVNVTGESWEKTVTLRENDVVFITLTKKND